MPDLDARVRSVHDLGVAAARESAGLHGYDGVVQDLSCAGVQAGLRALGDGGVPEDPHDARHLATAEADLRTRFGDLQEHRHNPLLHIEALDVSCYDRPYAPAPERAAARARQLSRWPEAVDTAVRTLDGVPAPVARALLPAAQGLAVGVTEDAARRAHGRLVAHLEEAARTGDPDPALGGAQLARLLGDAEAMTVDLTRLTARADAERDRLVALLSDSCRRYAPGRSVRSVVAELISDYPGTAEEIYAEARALVAEATSFTLGADLLDDPGGECLVGPAPASRAWAMAMLAWAAPYEPDGPSAYWVTPPDPGWTDEEQREWLSVFSRTTLPAITVHEVTPGHFAHGRFLRRATGPVRRSVYSWAFVEGWAHYAEELLLEEGFRAGDPRYAIGVAIEALVRVTRLAVSIGLHSGAMSVAEATRRFVTDAHLAGRAAQSEAARATFDPTYGRYTWGKLAILEVRDEARRKWGSGYSHRRFHQALLDLGSPPLGLLSTALERGAPPARG
ncbi:MAG: DUF885 family protein [Mycobacteriales bacterium]